MKALKLAEAAETTMRPGGLADEVARELRCLAEVNAAYFARGTLFKAKEQQ